MLNEESYEIQRSFTRIPVDGYNSISLSYLSCPPYIIASVAMRRVVEGAELKLPEDYDTATLNSVAWLTGVKNENVHVSDSQAHDLKEIGSQLLALDNQGKIEPPLTTNEQASIRHLVDLVEKNKA